ncbi:MAG: PDZ domain-containing protein [Nitrospira sp.]|nr:PDZ domain-containing protein [Nitrospira sp.]MCS6318022.1 PDZ domain-containing protein [Nitrospira sp.]
MKKHIDTSAYLIAGFLSLCLIPSPAATGTAWADDGHEKSGAPAPTFSLESTIPDGVIGVSLHVGAERVGETAVLYIAHVLPDGPAQQAGLKQGDEVTTVDGVAVTGRTYEQVALMVRGEPGSVVKLGVKSEGGSREVSVTRVSGQTLYKGQMGSHGGSGR